MLVCGAALAAALFWLGLPWQGALAAGMALALSSTAIAVQTMAERNLLSAPVGRSAFSVLLFQDIAAIPLIALVPLSWRRDRQRRAGVDRRGQGDRARSLAVIVIGEIITPRLMRLIALSRVREIFTAFALLLVIGIAELMSIAGLSMALGRFPRRRAAREFRVSPRARDRHRAVQGAAARFVLHRGGHVDRLRPGGQAAAVARRCWCWA